MERVWRHASSDATRLKSAGLINLKICVTLYLNIGNMKRQTLGIFDVRGFYPRQVLPGFLNREMVTW